MDRDPLSQAVIGCAMKVHSKLGPGFLEAIYHRALEIEFAKQNIVFQSQKPIAVVYEGINIGEFACDLLVEGKMLIEIKAVQSLNAMHEVQVVNYLSALRIDVGLLVNFGAPSLEFKRKFRTHQPLGTPDFR